MSTPRRTGYRLMQTLALLAMSLRVLVPGGYMPASVADGWYLQWCPNGVSAQVLQGLFGAPDASGNPSHGHHAHHAMVAAAVDATPGALADGGPSYAQCDLSGFSADAHDGVALLAVSIDRTPGAALGAPPEPVHLKRFARYRSRAPPRSIAS